MHYKDNMPVSPTRLPPMLKEEQSFQHRNLTNALRKLNSVSYVLKSLHEDTLFYRREIIHFQNHII